jgi:hypothetical protein
MATYKMPHGTLTTSDEFDAKGVKARADREAEVQKQGLRGGGPIPGDVMRERNQANAVDPMRTRQKQVARQKP